MTPNWSDIFEIIKTLGALVVTYIAWSAKGYIDSQTEHNREQTNEIKTLHSRITSVEKDLSWLKGAHEANHTTN